MKEFYGLAGITGASMFVRDDYNQTNEKKEVGSKSIYFVPDSARELLAGDIQGDFISHIHVYFNECYY